MIAHKDMNMIRGGNKSAGAVDDARITLNEARAARGGAEAATAAELLAEAPTVTERVLGTADKSMQYAGMLSFIPTITGVAFTGATGKLGQWFNIKPLKNFSERSKVFHEKVTESTVSQLGERVGVRGGMFQPAFNVAGNVGDWLGNVTGVSKWRRGANIGKTTLRFENARANLGSFNLHEVDSKLRPHVETLQQIMEGTYVPKVAAVPEMAGVVAGAESTVGKTVIGAGEAVAHSGVAAPLLNKFGHPHIDAMRNSLSEIAKVTSHKDFGEISHNKATAKGVGSFLKNVTKGVASHDQAIHWEKPGNALRGAPKAIGGMSALDGVMHGSFIAGSAISMANDAHHFMTEREQRREMENDLRALNKGGESEIASTAKWKSLKSLFVSEAADAVGMLANIKGAKPGNNWGLLKSSMAYMLPSVVASAYNSSYGETIVPLYHQLNRIHKAGQPIPAEGIAALLNASSKDLRDRGPNNPFTRAIAQQYAAEHLSPAQVLHNVETGEVMSRVHKLITSHDAAQHPANQAKVSHVARVQGNSPQATREAKGMHTSRLQEQSIGGAPGVTPS